MAPRDHSGLSLRWSFVPVIEGSDRAVYWHWEVFTQSGQLVASSAVHFDTLTECIEDATRNGYRPPK